MIRCDKLARGAGGLVHQERSVARGATVFAFFSKMQYVRYDVYSDL